MFEKNLNDLVRGLRNNKSNEAKYVTESLDEIKQELRQENMAIKANAILKLSYVQMLGYDISWAAFNVIEVMSSAKFTHKRIAYMAASQSFHSELDVLMLATNLIKKDMNSQNQYDAGVAMVGLSCFISPDLARDLATDIMNMMVSSRPYVRKRAILLMYKVFLNFPEALRPAFPRLKEKLEDMDPGVQCAAVNVICELARKNPRNYLALAPLFFKLMTTSSNNWMLIKIIKLFGALCPLEPRLGKKLLEPLTSLIHRCCSEIKKCRRERNFAMATKKILETRMSQVNGDVIEQPRFHNRNNNNEHTYIATGISTSAMSLLYECVNTVVAGLPDHQASMQLCVSKLRLLVEDPDQNLKYLGLLLLNKILSTQPKLVLGHRDLILQCLDDRDESIRYRALDLIVGMISRKTLVDITKKLLLHMEKAEGTAYRDELLAKIIQICSQSNYQYITNFEWYIDILLQLSSVEGTQHGKLIANQMLDVTIRVKAIRPQAVPTFASLLGRSALLTGNSEKNTACEVLFASAWVAGEFAEYLPDIQTTMKYLLNPRVDSLPGHIQCVYVQAIAKLFSRVLTDCEKDDNDEELEKAAEFVTEGMTIFTQSSDLEVQDRSCCVLQLVKLVMKMKKEGVKCASDVNALFAEELLPVAPKAQKKVPIPEGLDLDKWINEPLSDTDDSDEEDSKPFFDDKSNSQSGGSGSTVRESYHEPDEQELEKAREMRRMFQESNPHYLKGEVKSKRDEIQKESVDNIPVKQLDAPVSLRVEGGSTKKGKKKKGKRGKKGRLASESEEEAAYPTYEIAPVIDLGSGDQDIPDELDNNDPHNLLNVDLDTPLGDHEALPVQTHRVVETKSPEQPAPQKKSKKKKGKGDKESKKKSSSKDDADGNSKKEKEGSSKKEKGQKKSKKKGDSLKKWKKDEEEKKSTLLAQASEYAKEKEAMSKGLSSLPSEGMDGSVDFWLTPTEDPPTEPTSTKDTAPPAAEPAPVEEASPKEKKSKRKSKEKSTKEKPAKEKKKKKKSKTEDTPTNETASEPVQETSLFMDLDDSTAHDPYAHYSTLCEDSNIKLLYEIRPHPMQEKQVVCSIIFRNLTSHHVQKLEFNVIDSLSMKLVRQVGASQHDPVLVPFVLLPDMTNEGQFAFNVDSCVMSQHLRGTLTYILKQPDSSTSEKIDFKIEFRIGVYIVPKPISSDDFTALLAGGELKEKQSTKISLNEDKELEVVLQNICAKLRLLVVEHISGGGASLYGSTMQDHPICLLVKKVSDSTFSIDGKSTDFQLLSSIFKEIKEMADTM